MRRMFSWLLIKKTNLAWLYLFYLNIFGKKYFEVLFYECETSDILNKKKNLFFCMDPFKNKLFNFFGIISILVLKRVREKQDIRGIVVIKGYGCSCLHQFCLKNQNQKHPERK